MHQRNLGLKKNSLGCVFMIAGRNALILCFTLVGLAAFGDAMISTVVWSAYCVDGGFIYFRPQPPASREGVVFGNYFLSTRTCAANLGWLGLGGGTSANGIQCGNHAAFDYGVNHARRGNSSEPSP